MFESEPDNIQVYEVNRYRPSWEQHSTDGAQKAFQMVFRLVRFWEKVLQQTRMLKRGQGNALPLRGLLSNHLEPIMWQAAIEVRHLEDKKRATANGSPVLLSWRSLSLHSEGAFILRGKTTVDDNGQPQRIGSWRQRCQPFQATIADCIAVGVA